MAVQDKERDKKQEFRHPEVVAYLRSLSAAEAALNRPMIRQDGDGFLEYRIFDGTVICRRLATTELPGHEGSAARSPDLLPRLEKELAATVVDLDAVETALRGDALVAAAAQLRLLLEARDDALDPPHCPHCGGRMARWGDKRPKTYMTRLGKVTVARRHYRCSACRTGLFPLDAALRLEGRTTTPGYERMVMAAAAEVGSRRAVTLLEELSGTRVSRSRFDRLARALGREVVAFERRDVPPAAVIPTRPVVAADGTGVPIRPAELAGRAGKQADGTARTREAKLLRICEVAPDPKGRIKAVAGSITQSSVIDSARAPTTGGMSEFAARVRREAQRRGVLDSAEAVILSDGAAWIEKTMRTVFAGMHLTFVLDLFHVLERLQEALKETLEDPVRRQTTFDRIKARIKAGEAARVLAALATLAKSSPAIRAFVNYCRPNLHRMRYDVYTRQGLPCGSGLVEGGCRTVVVDRLKKSGSRWSVDGANAIMAIRCCQMNNRVADFFHWRAAA